MILIYSLIIFFTFLLFYQFLAELEIGKEGLDMDPPSQYQNYDQNPALLAYKNAANIEVLKQDIDALKSLKKQVEQNTKDIKDISSQATQLIQQQGQFAQQNLPINPPNISGIN